MYNPSISEMFLIKLLENLFTFRNENIHFTKSYYCQKNIGIEKTEANLISVLLGDKKNYIGKLLENVNIALKFLFHVFC